MKCKICSNNNTKVINLGKQPLLIKSKNNLQIKNEVKYYLKVFYQRIVEVLKLVN